MRLPLIAGNWKMHGSLQSVVELSKALVGWNPESKAEMAVCPPSVFLSVVAKELQGSSVALGAQNVSEHQQGAYTGEVSGDMLAELGCRYAIVGHSERRALFAETDRQIAEKFIAAQRAGLTPILCVGETLEQREADATLDVIAEQLGVVIDVAGLEAVAKGVVAYEPVWAIGTGKTATPEQAQQVHAAIRLQLGEAGAKTRVLYGGSVKAANAAEIFAQPDIDGALVGGASLVAEEFLEVGRLAAQ
ncbi:triose-phosphate isomerase [Porticoccaceae bacterium LTM1]|nr:triose-phosphate isomerase [Porticoccaceae bacterium LTM1]